MVQSKLLLRQSSARRGSRRGPAQGGQREASPPPRASWEELSVRENQESPESAVMASDTRPAAAPGQVLSWNAFHSATLTARTADCSHCTGPDARGNLPKATHCARQKRAWIQARLQTPSLSVSTKTGSQGGFLGEAASAVMSVHICL